MNEIWNQQQQISTLKKNKNTLLISQNFVYNPEDSHTGFQVVTKNQQYHTNDIQFPYTNIQVPNNKHRHKLNDKYKTITEKNPSNEKGGRKRIITKRDKEKTRTRIKGP